MKSKRGDIQMKERWRFLFLSRGVNSCGSKYLLDRISASGSSIALFSFSMISDSESFVFWLEP